MYNFVDTTNQASGIVLPSEALQINGEYIENLIPGYRTISVSGREALSPELLTYEVGTRDGAKLLAKRFPPRSIIVKYQINAESPEAFREAYNKLGGILNVENAELIFNDETDKFFRGTPSLMGEVDPGKNNVVGEFEILCVDPFKYSVEEFVAEPSLDESSILIQYNGTHEAFPTLQASFFNEAEADETDVTLTGNGDCGYIAFFTEDEKIVQLGNPEEVDGDNKAAKAQTLMNQPFNSSGAWGTTAKKQWALNNATTIPAITKGGGVGMAVAEYGAVPGSTSGTLIKVRTSTGSPLVTYSVTAKATERTETAVKVTVTITTSLEASTSGIGTNREIEAAVLIGGSWHGATIKKKSAHWQKGQKYTTSYSFTVSGLTASQTSITGIKFKADRKDTLGDAGILAATNCNNLTIKAYTASAAASYYLTASGYGSASGWHGPTIKRAVPADAAGAVGAANFKFSYAQKMCIGQGSSAKKQMGAFQMHLLDSSGASVAGVRVWKNAMGTTGKIAFYVGGQQVYGTNRDLSYTNVFFGNNAKAVRTTSITKSGGKFVFNVGGIKKTITDSSLAGAVVTHAAFAFEQYGTNPTFAYNGVYNVKFVKNNCSSWRDVPNKFSAGDVVQADCKDGLIYLNGALAPELGALGNDWEAFALTPGLNQIGFAYSDWIKDTEAPAVVIKYREVYL